MDSAEHHFKMKTPARVDIKSPLYIIKNNLSM